MLKSAMIAAALLLATPATADELALDTSKSLSTLESEMGALPAPRGVDSLALGAVSFLRAIEATLQERYRTNAIIEDSIVDLPVLRLPVSPNPDPEPFEVDLIATIFSDVDSGMDRARSALSSAAIGADDKLVIDINRLWFDIDGNGSRGIDERMLYVIGDVLGGDIPVSSEELVVHFDAADAEWLAAYTHMLSGVAELVLAFDPTEVIADVIESKAAMADIRGEVRPPWYGLLAGEEQLVDTFATIYGALNRTPEATRTAAAKDHFLRMIDHNRAFWRLVDQETDNAFEWIPNAEQQAALGFELPADTGTVWQAVLTDAEKVLNGELLAPHWRTEPGGGVNVAKLFADPPAFDLVTWIQGEGLVPYMEKGPLVDWASFQRFTRMFAGDAVLFVVLIN